MRLIARERGDDYDVSVYDTERIFGERGRYRVLQFADDAVQGVLDLDDPGRIVLEYPRAIMHLMEADRPSPEAVLIIGHGIGTIAGHFPGSGIITAEIDERVASLSESYFGCGLDRVVIADGRLVLDSFASGSLDCIVVDAFTDKGTPSHLASVSFFERTAEKLKARGIVILNLTGRSRGDKFVNAAHTTLGLVFPFTAAFELPGGDPADKRNIILAGGRAPIVFQAREMAGFRRFEPERGYPIRGSRHSAASLD